MRSQPCDDQLACIRYEAPRVQGHTVFTLRIHGSAHDLQSAVVPKSLRSERPALPARCAEWPSDLCTADAELCDQFCRQFLQTEEASKAAAAAWAEDRVLQDAVARVHNVAQVRIQQPATPGSGLTCRAAAVARWVTGALSACCQLLPLALHTVLVHFPSRITTRQSLV